MNKINIVKLVFIMLLLLGISNKLQAEEVATSDNHVINVLPINVVGSSLSLSSEQPFNVPAMETIVNQNDNILNGTTHDLYGIAKTVPQLQVSGGPRRLAQSFTMRGFDKNGIAVMIDDIPVPFLSQHTNNLFVDSSMLSSVDVIRGPFSPIYGSDAVAGVVGFKTLEPEDILKNGKKYGGSIGLGYSSVDKGFSGNITTYAKSEHASFLAGVNSSYSGRIKSGNNGQVNIPEKDAIYNGLIKSKLDLSDSQYLKISYYFNQSNSKVPANPEQNNQGDFMLTNIDHKVRINNNVVRLEHNYISEDGSMPDFKTIVYYDYSKQEEDPQQDFPGGLFYNKGDNLGKTLNVFGGKHQEHIGVNINDSVNTSIVYGVSYEGQKQIKNNSDPRGLIANASSNNVGGFINNEWFLTQYINVTGALRYDYFNIQNDGKNITNPTTGQMVANSKTYNQLSPKASVAFKPFKPFMTYVSYGRGYRTPNLNEIYASGFHFITQGYMPGYGPYTMQNDLIPNPDLKPVTSDTMETGYGLSFKDLPLNGEFKLKNAFYYTKAKNYINLNMTQTTSQYVNVPSVEIGGIDADFSYVNSLFKVGVSYNYINAINTNTNTALMNISKNTANITFEQNIFNTGLSIGYNLRAQSSFNVCKIEPGMGNYACSMGQTRMPGFATHDIYLNYKHNNYAVAAGVDNIADKFYYDTFSGLPSGGINYKVMFTMSV